jgi:YD repeat-containing protein
MCCEHQRGCFQFIETTTYPDSSTQVLIYDAHSNVLSRQTRAGATISYTYDNLNRLSTKTAPSEPTATISPAIRSALPTTARRWLRYRRWAPSRR